MKNTKTEILARFFNKLGFAVLQEEEGLLLEIECPSGPFEGFRKYRLKNNKIRELSPYHRQAAPVNWPLGADPRELTYQW
jgi:hypothetical protein